MFGMWPSSIIAVSLSHCLAFFSFKSVVKSNFLYNGLGEAVSAVSIPRVSGWMSAHPQFTTSIKPSSPQGRTVSFGYWYSVLPLEPSSPAKVLFTLLLFHTINWLENWLTSVFELLIKKTIHLFLLGTSFLFTTTSSCTPTSQVSLSLAQCRLRLMSRTTQTGLYYTARVCRSPRRLYWTRTSLICLTR